MTAAELLSLREAAAAVRLPVSRLWRAAHDGSLATVRLQPRGRYYVTRADIAAWIDRHRTPAREPLRPTHATDIPLPRTLAQLMPRPGERRFA